MSQSSYSQFSSTIVCPSDSIDVGIPLNCELIIKKPRSDIFNSVDLTPLFNPNTLVNLVSDPDSNGVYKLPDFEINQLGSLNKYKEAPSVPFSVFEWTDQPSTSSHLTKVNIQYTFWDPGVFQLQGANFVFTDSNKRVLPLEGTQVIVSPPQIVQDTTQQEPIKPIKNIIEESSSWKDYWKLYLFVLGILIITSLLVWFLNRKKEVEIVEEVVPYVPPHIIALEKLKALRSEELWQQGEIKRYQSRLTAIIREYIDQRYGTPALEMTTDEIIRDLRKKGFESSREAQLTEILTMADLIKFAKAQPPKDIHERFMNTAVQFVQSTQSLEEE